jgi:hypothetical protein
MYQIGTGLPQFIMLSLGSQQASEQQPIGGTAFHVPVEGPARTLA